MTTIIARRLVEPMPAVILSTDQQASFDEPVQISKGIYFKPRKDYVVKITRNPDESLFVAMTGSVTPQYKAFANRVAEKALYHVPSKFNPLPEKFSLVTELMEHGASPTIRQLNMMSSFEGPEINGNAFFKLVVAYRTEDDVKLWSVSSTGEAQEEVLAVDGSGGQDALQAYNVLRRQPDLYDKWESDLARETDLSLRSVTYAALNDGGSSGLETFVIMPREVRNITHAINEPVWKKRDRETAKTLKSLEEIALASQ